MTKFDDHFAAACLTLIWGYRNPDKVNIALLDRNFKVEVSIGAIRMERYVPPNDIEFIDVLDPGDTDPVIMVVLNNNTTYYINPKARTMVEGVPS